MKKGKGKIDQIRHTRFGGAIRWKFPFRLLVCLILLPGLVEAKELTASWYDRASLIKEGTWKNGEEKKMANGERFNEEAFTCSSRDYPLHTWLRITNKKTGKWVDCLCTDRIGKRFAGIRIDLSKRAFAQIADLKQGIVPVIVTPKTEGENGYHVTYQGNGHGQTSKALSPR
jgi:rare lipoprotein A